MATQRYISTSFWDDEWIQTTDPSEKLLYLYLMTNPLTTISGAYKISIRRMVFDTGFNQETVERILEKFSKAAKAFHYREYIIIPSWPEHQKWESRSKIEAGIDADIAKIPEDVQKYMVSIGYRYRIKGYAYDRNYSDSDSDSDSKSDSKSDTDTEEKKREPKRFQPPTVEQVREYCTERNNGIDAEAFVAFYDSKGWKIGKDPMKKWKSAIITWEKRNGAKPENECPKYCPRCNHRIIDKRCDDCGWQWEVGNENIAR